MITVAYALTTLLAAAYAAFEARLLWYFLRERRVIRRSRIHPERHEGPLPDSRAPIVTIQLPIYNERTSAAAAVRAAIAQDYPAGRLEIQILDDSTDDTPRVIGALLDELRATGASLDHVHHIRRHNRHGYKAGALDHGLATSKGELVAIFDADFAPPPGFLRRIVLGLGAFDDSRVAFVQARWCFANSTQNALTAAQALLIDRHFFVQKPTWAHLGRVTVFNGSAGVWRRRAIDDAGGWSADTLTEDLDLSYRAAMRGWRSIYLADVAADSELPAHALAFKLQQRRWARGSAQAMKKLVPAVLRSTLLRSRADELFFIGGYVIHPILLVNTLLWPWAVLHVEPRPVFLVGQAVLSIATAVGPVSFAVTARELGRPLSRRFLRDVLVATAIGMGLMVNNTLAHVLGYLGPAGAFARTPKSGTMPPLAEYRLSLDWTLLGELALLAYSAWSAALLIRAGAWIWSPPCLMWCVCLGLMIGLQLAPQGRSLDPVLEAP